LVRWFRLMDGGGPDGGRAKPTPAEVRILPPPLVYPRLKPPGLSFGTVGCGAVQLMGLFVAPLLVVMTLVGLMLWLFFLRGR
jgi:hypothetical protein